MYFEFGLILLRYSSTGRVFCYHNYFCIQYNYYSNSYWLMIILFCFMLKKISNISKYSTFNCLTSFGLKKFLISLIAAFFVLFLYLVFLFFKDFLHLCHVFFYIFIFFKCLNISQLYVVKKSNYSFLKTKFCYTL